ncbi:alcohol dehydrogenase [Fistulina hepatica ATCC 64428]|uniref:Alcohol dehydrogenase n=1 Tax=Fistulina hepatica ATCC 64428 TaxID=1128425 RepID=A0A0D7ANT1_9AGAR|nr:alcohol dehydrogenase [Fistulina hepatica ATCC 64428]
MTPVKNTRVLFNEIPKGYPVPGKTTIVDDSQTIDLKTVPLNGGILLKVLVLSIDPYMRGKMREPTEESYSPPYLVGKPLDGHGVAVVLRSEFEGAKPGDHVYSSNTPFYSLPAAHQEYYVRPNLDGARILHKHPKLSWTTYVGAAGMPGQTAYMAWKEYSKAKKGETAFVTAGGGPVGSMVIQLAKLDGLKVIASAGSDAKVQFLKEIGADVAFNYKTKKTADVLKKEGPIDIYWDNVGGETLENALEAANLSARFLNLMLLVGKRITMTGFIVFDLIPKYGDEFYASIPEKLASGEIKFNEQVSYGLDKVGQVIADVQHGRNTGKAVIVVANE